LQVDALTISSISVDNQSSRIDIIKKKLPLFLYSYLDVFDRSKAEEIPSYRPYDYKIELLPDSKPPQTKAYRISPYKLQKIKEYLDKNLAKDYIVPSKAPYSSSVLFALKSNGDLRFCVDYRKLNNMTKKNRYPLPLIEEVIGKVMGCKYLIRLDIIAAFNKLRMHPESENYTTFITALEAYKYRVLPFGLTNGPASFQQYINDTLFDYLNDFCQAYLDNILIYSKTKEEHKIHVKFVLDKLRAAGLHVDVEKCEFDVSETTFLRVIVFGKNLRMDSKKVEAIVNWPTPINLKQIQGFVGFANFYRRFIRDFSRIVRPLTLLTKKDILFVWNEACIQAFQELKIAIISAPVLRHYDLNRQPVLETNLSNNMNAEILL